ncbi:MAG TPA: hypothetical protein EYQ36_10885 [Sulfitobacter sp.]|nr:hypothetical protein [Sulfitobacter sp.]
MLSLIGGLAVISVIPVVNLLSLGYLLHVSGTIARTGRLRDGFIGVRRAGRLGGIVLGTWLVLWPARLLAMLRDSAVIVDPQQTGGWSVGLWIITALTTLHISWALLRGGKLRHFLWPAPIRFFRWIVSPFKYTSARDALWETMSGLRLPYLLWLGARCFAGTLLWLLIPVGLMILAANIASNAGALVSLLGGLLLMGVLLYLPFLQVLFARENRFHAFLEIAEVRRLSARAPFMFWLALLLTLVLAVPLFLLKVELTPAEITWLPALFFVVFGLPARMMAGWAMGRAERREAPRHFALRWLFKLAALPVVFSYVVILFLTQFISWNGTLSLLEQHAFLVPSPF